MSFINYVVADCQLTAGQEVFTVQVNSLDEPVQILLDAIYTRHKLGCAASDLQAYYINNPLTDDGDLGPESTEKALNDLCRQDKLMRRPKPLKKYFTLLDTDRVQILIKVPMFQAFAPTNRLNDPASQSILPLECKFTYGNVMRIIAFEIQQDEVSLGFLLKQVKNLFTFPEGTKDSDITLKSHDRKDPKEMFIIGTDHLLRTEAKMGPITITITTEQLPLSSWSFKSFKPQFNITATFYAELNKFNLPKVSFNNNKTIQQLIDDTAKEVGKIMQICPPNVDARGKTFRIRSLVVYEVVKQVVCIYGRKSCLFIQKEVKGKLAHGPVDYMIMSEGLKKLLIVIVEAKQRDIDKAVAQCIIQLDSTMHIINSKRHKNDEEECYYKAEHLFGIVTTGDHWVFLRLQESRVLIHSERPFPLSGIYLIFKEQLKDQISDLFGYISGMYQLAGIHPE